MLRKNPSNRLSIIVTGLFCLILNLNSFNAFSQDFSNFHWYFGGEGTALQFNKFNNNAYTTPGQHAPLGEGGSAIAVDPTTGDILFYTDGRTIFDATGAVMPTGAVLTGDPDINQPAAIIPDPANPGMYYVFSNNGTNITYSMVDMGQPGNATNPGQPPLGSSIPPHNVQITEVGVITGEAMIIIPGSSPGTYYLVAQNTADGTYRVFTIDDNGISTPTTFDLSGEGAPDIAAANFSYNPATNQIAVAPAGNDDVQVLNFDPATGTLSFNTTLDGTANPDGVYDTEWSEDGTKLYISSGANGNGNVYQYNFTDQPPLSALLDNPVAASYGLKRGPDNKIYHIYQETPGGPFLMAAINAPDSIADLVEYQANLFSGHNFQGKQFPEIGSAAQDDCVGNIEAPATACQNNPVSFHLNVDPPAQSYSWDFGDGTTLTHQSPTYIYEEPGMYNVTLTAFCNGREVTFSHQINITENDIQIPIPADTTVCPGDLPFDLDATTEGAVSYRWSNGDTGPTFQVDSAGYYWVVVTTANGCEAYAGTNVQVFEEENRIGNIWYFGNSGGIDFNPETPEAIQGPAHLNTPEGIAVYSDRNGQVLFYTDGETVWDRFDDPMMNGDDIGGSQNSTQSAIIIPFGSDETMFYVFTPEEIYGNGTFQLNYSIVDIKGNNGLGEVVAKDIPLFSRSTERVTAIETGNGYALITHDYGNNTFRVYPIDENGIGTPVLSSVGSIHSTGNPLAGQSYMKVSPDGSKIAVALPGPPHAVEVFDFDPETLEISNPIRLDLDANQMPYGIEFSGDGSFLYVSTNNNGSGPSHLFQYVLVDGDGDRLDTPQKHMIRGPESETYGALQIGPTGSIFMAVNGAGHLLQINNPFANADTTTISITEFDLFPGTSSTLGLPNFIQTIFQQPSDPTMSVNGFCIDDPTTFVGTPAYPDIDEANWTVTNIATGEVVFTSTEFETEHTFLEPGDYEVKFEVTNRCGYYFEEIEIIEIIGPPEGPDFNQQLELCEGSLILEAAPEGTTGLTYLWPDGSTGRTYEVTEGGLVRLIIAHEGVEGCTTEGEFFVADARVRLDLGGDRVVCQYETLVIDSHVERLPLWFINGAQAGQGRRLTIDTSNPDNFDVIVEVADPLTQCISRDTINVTINAVPTIDYSAQSSDCVGDDGIIEIIGGYPPHYTFQWTAPDGSHPVGTKLEDLSGGMYLLLVTDENTSCTNTYHIPVPDINMQDFVVSATPQEACEGEGSIEFEFDLSIITGPNFTYRLHDINNNDIVSNGTHDQATLRLDNLSPSTYILEVEADECVGFSDEIQLDALPGINLDVEESVSGCVEPGEPFTVAVNNPDPQFVYTWTNSNGTLNGIVGDNTGSEIEVNASGIYSVTVSDPNGVECPTTELVEVELTGSPQVSIVADGDGCEGRVLLTAEPSPNGIYSFLWSNGMRGQTIQVTTAGSITVRAYNFTTSCEVTSEPFDVEVDDVPLEVSLTSNAACEGASFLLSATANQTGLTYIFRNPSGQEIANGSESEIEVDAAQPEGIYTVTVLSANGCDAEASTNVSRVPFGGYNELPVSREICVLDDNPELNSVELDPGPGFEYSWRRPDGTTLTGAQTIRANQPGLYILTLTNSLGCTLTDSTEIIVSCEPAIFGPNAFSPNGNGLNETFSLHTRYISEFDIKIFNRWGELIFQSNDTNFEWDGVYRGKLVPNGTYPYLIKYRSEFDSHIGLREMRGGVTVVK